MRTWPLVALMAFVLGGCKAVTGGGDEDCGTTPDDGCSYAECIDDPNDPEYGSCGGNLYECVDGEWERVGYCEPRPLYIHGTWTLTFALTYSDPCPAFDLPDEIVFVKEFGYDGPLTSPDPNVVIEDVSVEEGFHGSTADVSYSDYWGSPDGFPVSAPILLHLDFTWEYTSNWENVVSGMASSSFPYDTPTAGTTCNYAWNVTGTLAGS